MRDESHKSVPFLSSSKIPSIRGKRCNLDGNLFYDASHLSGAKSHTVFGDRKTSIGA